MNRSLLLKIFIPLAILALMGAAIDYFLTRKIDDLLRSRIGAQLGKAYNFNFAESKFDILRNDVRIMDLQLARKSGDSLQWDFKVDQLKLTGFKPLAFIRKGLLAADSITVSEPELNVYRIDLRAGNKQAISTDSTDNLVFSIEQFRIEDAKVLYDPNGPEKLSAALDVRFQGIMFEGNILQMTHNMERLDVQLADLQYITRDSVYTISSHALNISKTDDEVRIDSLTVKNNIDVTSFSRFMHWRKSLFDIEVPEVRMSLPRNQDSLWAVNEIEIIDPRILIMKDARFPLPDRHTELPQEQLKSLAMKFSVTGIDLINANIELLTRVSGASTSELSVSNIHGRIHGMQNLNLSEPAYRLEATGSLMNKADLKTSVTYLYGEVNPFHLEGSVNDVRLGFIDHYLRRQLGLAVASGELDGIAFNMSGDHNGISGEVQFRYHDLRIHMVDKDTDEKKVILNLLSDSAGRLFFYRENPHKEKLRLGRFYVERDVRRGFVSQWVDGLMQGIVNSISRKEIDLKEAGSG